MPLEKQSPLYLLKEEDRERIDRMISLVHLFVTELIDYRKLEAPSTDLTAFDEFEAYLERISSEARRANGQPEGVPHSDF